MRIASDSYKEIMSRKIRNRGYVSVGLGIINQDAQKDGYVSSDCVEWCNTDAIFENNASKKTYATMEENFFKLDGSMYFLPEEYIQEPCNCAITKKVLQPIRIDFHSIYSIKGLSITFGEIYPTEFTIETEETTFSFENNQSEFTTTEALGDTSYIIITPVSMPGGQQRMRIYNVVMGIGLNFSNKEVQDISVSDAVSTISTELPNITATMNLFDKEKVFNVDDSNSFIQYLETKQSVTLSFGLEMDDGRIEWIKYATLFLEDWNNKNNLLSISAVDRITSLEEEYSIGNKIYSRTAYEEAVSILEDAGVSSTDYVIDEYLKDITLTNPTPIAAHRECLQLLANACRCILYQDTDGRINIKANFMLVMNPDEIIVEDNGSADWGKTRNVFQGSEVVYADMTRNQFKLDGSMFFLPDNKNYLRTGYVSESISQENGLFKGDNPHISIILPVASNYYGLLIKFGGKVPRHMIVRTFLGDEKKQEVEFTELTAEMTIKYDFLDFDNMILEFVETEPYSRILVNQLSFGDFVDYTLTKDSMLENPHGYSEEKVKSVSVKVFTYTTGDDGNALEVEDNVYVKQSIAVAGKNIVCQNQLISTEEHARMVAEWMGNYYANNISYDVAYRGDPRLAAADIINMENDIVNNLQVEIAEQTLNFNGAFSGNLLLRRALRMVE